MKKMVVVVNNEFDNDPRVNRCVMASKQYFDQIIVLSGVPSVKNVKTTTHDGITVKRYYYFKPNFSNSKIIKKTLNIAAQSGKNNNLESEKGSNANSMIRSLLFMGWFFYILFMNLWILLRFAGLKADIYYANDFDTLLVSYLMAKLHRGKLIYDAHELYSDLLNDSPKLYKKLVMSVEGQLARKSSFVITVNNPIANILKNRYRLKAMPVVLYNTPYYHESAGQLDRTPLQPFKLLYHGMYLPGRDLDVLVRSMKDVTNFRLYFRGFGVLEESLRQLVLELGLSERVFFLEPVAMTDMVASAIGFDMGIIPYPGSQNELNSYLCTPNKIFEYMMAGLALAASDLPVLREIVLTHHLGVIFDKSNPAQMAETLNKISLKDILDYKKNSLSAARDIYNYNQESRKLLEIYDQLYQAQ